MNGVEELHNNISNHLNSNVGVVGKYVGFQLRDREVLLIGLVRTYFQKQMAQECLRTVVGGRRIVNTLKVASARIDHRATS